MFDLISHFAGVVIGLVTAVVALMTAWFKLRADKKPAPSPASATGVLANVDRSLRSDPQRTGEIDLRAAAWRGGAAAVGVFAGLEVAHAGLSALHAHAEVATNGATLASDIINSCCSS